MLSGGEKPRLVFHHGHALIPNGHGGNRRSRQIDELLRTGAYAVHSAPGQLAGGLAWNFSSGILGLLNVHRPPLYRYRSLRGLKNFGAALKVERSVLRQAPAVHFFDTHICIYEWLVPTLKSNGSKVVFVPQNIDSLTPGFRHPISGERSPSWLRDELGALSLADHVFTISREEEWLLNASGVSCSYLPYQPTVDVMEELQSIRALRESSSKDIILILGSATNAPTMLGMRTLARYSGEILQVCGNRRVVVAGFGTESLRSEMAQGVEILGAVTSEVLKDLLVRAHASIAYQSGTSGVLTRLVEMSLAGVPVIANPAAARSAYDLPGVKVVRDMSELIGALEEPTFESFRANLMDLRSAFWTPLERVTRGI